MDILIVESDYNTVLDLKAMLEKLEHNVVEVVSTGEKAIQDTSRLNPDLILINIQLEGKMSGVETAKIIEKEYHIPLIFLTVFIKNCLNMSLQLEENAIVLSKPINQNHLKYAIDRALSEHKTEKKS